MPTRSADSNSYRQLPAADYTPANDLRQWSVGNDLKSFAASLDGELKLECVLAIDDKGYIRGVRIVKSSDDSQASKVRQLITGGHTAGPSYDHNKAVSCYVPCVIHIKDHQVTIS